MARAAIIRLIFWAALVLIGVASCGAAVSVGPESSASAGEAAFAEAVVDDVSGAQPGLRRIVTFALADGSTVACGEWTAPDGIGTTDWAPFYIRWRGAQLLRVHLDDATGFGPALQGCNMARAGRINVTG